MLTLARRRDARANGRLDRGAVERGARRNSEVGETQPGRGEFGGFRIRRLDLGSDSLHRDAGVGARLTTIRNRRRATPLRHKTWRSASEAPANLLAVEWSSVNDVLGAEDVVRDHQPRELAVGVGADVGCVEPVAPA